MICVYCVTKAYLCKGQFFYEDRKHNNLQNLPVAFNLIYRNSQSNWEILSNCCSLLRKPKLYETSNTSKHLKPRPFTFCPVSRRTVIHVISKVKRRVESRNFHHTCVQQSTGKPEITLNGLGLSISHQTSH